MFREKIRDYYKQREIKIDRDFQDFTHDDTKKSSHTTSPISTLLTFFNKYFIFFEQNIK